MVGVVSKSKRKFKWKKKNFHVYKKKSERSLRFYSESRPRCSAVFYTVQYVVKASSVQLYLKVRRTKSEYVERILVADRYEIEILKAKQVKCNSLKWNVTHLSEMECDILYSPTATLQLCKTRKDQALILELWHVCFARLSQVSFNPTIS